MQSEIVSMNGSLFKIWYESYDDRINALKEVESKITLKPLAPTGPASRIVGQTVQLTSSPSGGTAPYIYTFWKLLDTAPAGTPPTVIGTANQASNTVYYTLVSTDIGPLRFGVDIQDSCPTGARSNTETWLVDVGPACTDPVANLTVS